jgi:hypothetical protein
MAKSFFLYIASSKEVVNEEIKEWRGEEDEEL